MWSLDTAMAQWTRRQGSTESKNPNSPLGTAASPRSTPLIAPGLLVSDDGGVQRATAWSVMSSSPSVRVEHRVAWERLIGIGRNTNGSRSPSRGSGFLTRIRVGVPFRVPVHLCTRFHPLLKGSWLVHQKFKSSFWTAEQGDHQISRQPGRIKPTFFDTPHWHVSVLRSMKPERLRNSPEIRSAF
jgi:hypothetical protein